MTRGSKLFKDKFNRLGWETKYDSVEGYLDQAGIIYLWKKSVYLVVILIMKEIIKFRVFTEMMKRKCRENSTIFLKE
jgi:hypothetical protein